MVIEATKTEFGYIRPTQIVDEMRSSYLDYAMSVIVSRALPDIRDGLKPVQRRILYAMQDLGMRPNVQHKKSARLVGEVLGKWHPHGEGAVYDALVRMAQPFSLRMPLVDGQGNFGSVDNDPPAAMRYTEARMAPIAEEMLTNIDQNTVDFVENFDGTLSEPEVLPARLPNLLVNGASGIAVGMATNIPPHNPIEVCDALIHLADHPSATVEDLMKFVKGPDFPTGGIIMGTDGIQNAYATGRGQVVVRAKARIEPMRRSNRMQIIVSELPYQVNKAALVEKVAALVKDRKIEGISDLRDESDREGMRVVFELRAGVQPRVVLNNLYKLTAMQSSFSANMLALVDKMPRVFTLRQALRQFLEFRQEVVRRRTEFDLARAKQRAHILAGLRIALSHLDAVIDLIRNSESAQAARQQLIERFGLDDGQAQAILDMQLRRLAALEREQLEKEYQELQDSIRDMEELLADEKKVLAVIKKELRDLKKKHGDERRTEISGEAFDISREELEAHEQIVVTLSQGGYIKRIPANTFRNQHRGGKGVGGMTTRDNDAVKHLLIVDTHDRLLFFTNKGRVYSLTAFELRADTSRNTRGVPVINVISMTDTEKVSAVIGVNKEDLQKTDRYLVLATANGRIKRVSLTQMSSIRNAGLNIMGMMDNDELVSARLAASDDHIVMITERGMSIRFESENVRPQQRGARGVIGMNLANDDKVVSMDVGKPKNRLLLVISKFGFGKKTKLSEYRLTQRGGKGVKTLEVTAKTGPVADAQIIDDTKEEVYVVSENAQVIRTSLSTISVMGRATQGVTILKPSKGDSVASISCVSDLNLIEEAAAKKSATPKARKPASANGRRNGRVNGAQGRLDGIE